MTTVYVYLYIFIWWHFLLFHVYYNTFWRPGKLVFVQFFSVCASGILFKVWQSSNSFIDYLYYYYTCIIAITCLLFLLYLTLLFLLALLLLWRFCVDCCVLLCSMNMFFWSFTFSLTLTAPCIGRNVFNITSIFWGRHTERKWDIMFRGAQSQTEIFWICRILSS